MNRLRILRSTALLGSGLALAAAAEPPAAKHPPPKKIEGFLSACAEKEGVTSRVTSRDWVERPDKAAIQAPYYDIPFAVHVPVAVDREAGIVRIDYALSWTWEDAPKQMMESSSVSPPVDFGLYRGDGKALAPGSVMIDTTGIGEGGPSWRKLLLDDGPIPVWTLPWNKPDVEERSDVIRIRTEKGAHVPFESGTPTSFVLAPAEAGSYVLWFAFDLLRTWPPDDPKRTELKGKLHVDVVVCRGQHGPRSSELAYLFGRGGRPSDMPDDNLFETSAAEIPIVLRRNGWTFDHSEVRGRDKSVKQAHTQFATYMDIVNTDVTSQSSAGGPVVTLDLTSKSFNGPIGGMSWGNHPSENTYTEKDTWSIQLPLEAPDQGFAPMKVGGGEDQTDNRKNAAKAVGTDIFHVNWEPGVEEYLDGPRGSSSLHMTIACSTREVDDQKNDAALKYSFLARYGADAIDWWVGDYRKILRTVPEPGQPPYRYSLFCGSPQDTVEGPRAGTKGHPYPLIALDCGPWIVAGYYRRLSDGAAPGAAAAAPTSSGPNKLADEIDPFWKWFVGFSQALRQQYGTIEAGKAEAGLIGLQLEQNLRSAALLLDSLNSPDNSQSDAAFARMVHKEKELSQGIRDYRQRLDQINAETRQAYEQIIAQAGAGFDRFGEKHPEILLWRKQYRDERDQLPFELAQASGDVQALKKAAEAAETQGLSARSRLIEADLLRRSGDPIGSLTALRSAKTLEPDDGEVDEALKQSECAFLKTAIDKSQGAIKAARAAFYGYLMERGFGSADVSAIGQTRWWEVVVNPWSVLDSESAWALFTTGAAGSLSAILGKPEAEAQLLRVTETQMTTAFIGLHTMLRLRMKGHSLADIQTMTSEQLKSWLPVKDIQGRPFTEVQVHQLGVAIREALQLPDVQALVADDRIGLQLGIKKGYWNPRDVGDTWLEWLGDSTSVFNLFTLLPSALGGRLPTAVIWGAEELEAVERAREAGQTITGTELIARYIGLERALQAAGQTKAGQAVLAELIRSQKYQASLGLAQRVGWGAGKVVATIALQTLAVHLADVTGGHKAALAVQALLLFAGDSEALIKMLQGQNVALTSAEKLLRARVIPAMRREAKLLTDLTSDEAQFRAIMERADKGVPITQEEFTVLERKFGKGWLKQVPNGRPSNDLPIAMRGGAQGVQNGVNNGGLDAAHALLPAAQADAAEVTATAEATEKLADDLARAQPAPPPGLPAAPEPLLLPELFDITMLPFPREIDAAGYYAVPPAPPAGSLCAEAEAALQGGNYSEAYEKFRSARYNVQKGFAGQKEELPLDFIDLKMALAEELSALPRERPTPGSSTRSVTELVTEKDMEELTSRPDLLDLNSDQGAMGVMFAARDRPMMVKVVNKSPKIDEATMMQQVEGELVHSALAQALGMPAPSERVRLTYGGDGQLEKITYVMRRVEGRRRLADLPAGEIFQYREELARHRALAVLIDDYDRKIDNYMVANDGGLIPIDAGQADPSGQRCLSRKFAVDAPEVMEGLFGRDHWLSRSFENRSNGARINLKASDPVSVFLRKNLMAEQALTYQAARPSVEAIDALVKDEPKLRGILQEAYGKIYGTQAEVERQVADMTKRLRAGGQTIDEEVAKAIRRHAEESIANLITAKVDLTVKTLQKRNLRLDGVMRGLNKRNGTPLPGSPATTLVFPPPKTWRIAA